MKRSRRSVVAVMSPFRRLMLLAVVFAVSLQAYFVQTHLHGQLVPQAGAAYSAILKAPAAPPPADPMSPALCKLCQEIVHAGTAITPSGSGLVLLLQWVALATPAAILPAPARTPRSGSQSRAPPQA